MSNTASLVREGIYCAVWSFSYAGRLYRVYTYPFDSNLVHIENQHGRRVHGEHIEAAARAAIKAAS